MITILVMSLLTCGGLFLVKGSLWGGYLLGLAAIMFGLGLRNIPAVPPSKGLVTIWGARRKSVISEGYTILAPYFPLFYDAIIINVEQKNQDIAIEGLRCNAQGQFQGSASVKIKVGITWQPDSRGERLYNYVGIGNEQGVRNILRDMMAEALRQYVAAKNWQELAHAGHEITQVLLQKLTGQNLSSAIARGVADIHGLGIIITRLHVGEIIPEGGTVAATEQATQTEILLNTAVMLKKAYEQNGENRTLDECMVEARRILTTQTGGGNFVDIPGLASLLQVFTTRR